MPPPEAVTFTVTVQEPLAGIEPPVRVTVELPALAASVPPHVVLAVLPNTTTPLGNVSVSGALRLAAVLLVLLKVRVRVETPPALTVAGPKALLIVGRMGMTACEHTVTVFVSNVTAPFCAKSLPATVAFETMVILVSAKTLPVKVVPAPIVAELPICQKTLHG